MFGKGQIWSRFKYVHPIFHGWFRVKLFDESTGNYYFGNTITGEATWTEPDGFLDSEKSEDGQETSSQKQAQDKVLSPDLVSGAHRRWSKLTVENVQEHSEDETATKVGTAADGVQYERLWDLVSFFVLMKHVLCATVVYPPFYCQINSAHYYLNVETQITQWEMPEGWVKLRFWWTYNNVLSINYYLFLVQKPDKDGVESQPASDNGPKPLSLKKGMFRRSESMMSWTDPEQTSPKNGAGLSIDSKTLNKIAHRRHLTMEEEGVLRAAKGAIGLKSNTLQYVCLLHGTWKSSVSFCCTNFRRSMAHASVLDLSRNLTDDESLFREHRDGIFKKKKLSEVLQWQGAPIKKSLLRLQKRENALAVQTFSAIQQFMNESETKTPRDLLAKQIYSAGLTVPAIRDEIYLQLCKQTNANPNFANSIEGWKVCLGTLPYTNDNISWMTVFHVHLQLFLLCACNFAPSKAFEKELIGLLDTVMHTSTSVNLIPFVSWRFRRTIASKPMSRPMSLEEVNKLTTDGIPSSLILFGGSLELIMSLQVRRYVAIHCSMSTQALFVSV